MNEAQHRAEVVVAGARAEARRLSRELAEAELKLKRAEERLRREVRLDPESWNRLEAVPGG